MTTFLRLLSDYNKESGLSEASQSIRCGQTDERVFEADPELFRHMPGAPFAYWVDERVRRAFRNLSPVETDACSVRQGLATADDFRFVRAVWEAPENGKWKLFAKGGVFSPFYSDVFLAINWNANGDELRAFEGSIVRNPGYYLRPGLTWPRRTKSRLSMRILPAGCIFADKGPAVFVSDDCRLDLLNLAAIFSSQAFYSLVEVQLAAADARPGGAAHSFEVGVIQSTPLPNLGDNILDLVRQIWSADASKSVYRPKPIWVWERSQPKMRVSDHVIKSAVFLGFVNDRNTFVAYGTGFCVLFSEHDLGFPYIVTARHVIEKIPRDLIFMRIAKRDGTLEVVKIPKDGIIYHPDHIDLHEGIRRRRYIDVAAIPIEFGSHFDDDLTWVTTSDFVTPQIIHHQNIGVGDEVAIIGAFFPRIGETKNIPIVRIGTVAAMPDEPVPTDFGFMEAYLIEARSIDGLSGSPVFLHMGVRPPLTKSAPLGSMRTHYLIGLIHGHYAVQTTQEMTVLSTAPTGDMNAGIAIVVPCGKILEMLDQPSQKEYRQKLAELFGQAVRTVADVSSTANDDKTTE